MKLQRGKIILNIFGFRGQRTLKPRSKFILKIYFLFNSKLNGQKFGFNTPLSHSQVEKLCYLQEMNLKLENYMGSMGHTFGELRKNDSSKMIMAFETTSKLFLKS